LFYVVSPPIANSLPILLFRCDCPEAVRLDPNLYFGYNNLGIIYKNMKRYDEAEVVYLKAIKLNSSDATIYSNLGNLLQELKRYKEAETAFRKAIELDLADATSYYNLGNLMNKLKRYGEAEAAYRKAIELNPSDAIAYNNLAIMLRMTGREYEAIPILEKIIENNPGNFNAYLGIASVKKTLGVAIEPSIIKKARQYIPEDGFYNRACLESVCGHFDLSFEYLLKATRKEKFDSKWAWEDPDLQWIRSDPRFKQIVGEKPAQ
jgi:tetratricopeptide (TPR) repeat protein